MVCLLPGYFIRVPINLACAYHVCPRSIHRNLYCMKAWLRTTWLKREDVSVADMIRDPLYAVFKTGFAIESGKRATRKFSESRSRIFPHRIRCHIQRVERSQSAKELPVS